ncbi:MAG: VWA domain-containing protein [Planctomycetes bacterium]|nr:VWA domain-containing protein [Planctomycetota bacterium]
MPSRIVALLILATGLAAQETTQSAFDEQVRAALTRYERHVAISAGARVGPRSGAQLDAAQLQLREPLLALIRANLPAAPTDPLASLDRSMAYEALASPQAGVTGPLARRLVMEFLPTDADSPAAFALVDSCRRDAAPPVPNPGLEITIEFGNARGADSTLADRSDPLDFELLAWVLTTRADARCRGAFADALDVLVGTLAGERGSVDGARRSLKALVEHAQSVGAARAVLERVIASRQESLDQTAPRSREPGAAGWAAFRDQWHALRRAGVDGSHPRVEAALGWLGSDTRLMAALLAPQQVSVPTREESGLSPDHDRVLRQWAEAAGKAEALTPPGRGQAATRFADAVFDLGLVSDGLTDTLVEIARQNRDWKTQSMALRALARQELRASAGQLAAFGRSKIWQVRLAYAESLAAYRHRDAVEAAIGLLGDERLRVRRGAARSLALLTGRNLGASQKRWVAWLDEQAPDWEPLARVESPITNEQIDAGADYARYYELEIASDRLAFVLDKSESMYWGLWDGAVEQTMQFLAEAGPTTSFGVVAFDESTRAWKKRLTPVSASAAKKARSFLHRGKPYGPTNVIDALRAGMDIPECDAIVLLSDGLPNRGDPSDPQAILDDIRDQNRYLRLQINTVQMLRGRAFAHDAPRDAEQQPLSDDERARRSRVRDQARDGALGSFLARLAADNEGQYGVGFGDYRLPPPGGQTRPGTDH